MSHPKTNAAAEAGGDEAARDPGVRTALLSNSADLEGHRVFTGYGFHMPTSGYRRRPHRRHHKHMHKITNGHGKEKRSPRDEDDDEEETLPQNLRPSDRVHFILGEEDNDGHESHPLFSELAELSINNEELEWRETARWIKFEEDVEEGGNRWSKPHVGTISLHSLFELRSCILNGTVILDMEASSLDQIADLILENMVSNKQLSSDISLKVKEALLRRHRHQHERKHDRTDSKNRLPIIRSLADIGRNSSKSMFGSHTNSDASMPASPSSHSLHAHIGHDSALVSGASSSDLQHKLNQAFMRKIPHGSEADNILVGEIDYLDCSVSAFVRLRNACQLGDLTEVPVPTRFLFVLLGPHSHPGRYHEVGRAMATLMSDEVFHDVAYKAKSRDDLLAGVDEFLDAVTILPPGAWDPAIRIEPPAQMPSQEARKKVDQSETKSVDSDEEEERERAASGLKRTGKWFGGLKNDIKRKLPWYLSDFTDAFATQTIASIFFLYFACLTPIITFGGLLGTATGNNIATMESLMSGLLCGVLYGFFAGQPLTILGSTGPVLVFETILYDFCRTHDYHYLNLRLYIGLWMMVILFLMVATDLSYLVCYITRFTEENFATLISVIFIFKAFENLLHIAKDYPVDRTLDNFHNYTCECVPLDGEPWLIQNYSRNDPGLAQCSAINGTLLGAGCSVPTYVPNVFYLSCILFAATYVISIALKDFKTSSFFPTKVRQTVSDFAVPIAIASMTLADYYININTPKLYVPSEFKPTRDDRGWLVPFFHEKNPIWFIPLAILPAIFSTILIFMDQQITAVIVNRKEYKLKKGCGYHLDLAVLSILVGLCSIMGLPWFVAATVLAMTHVNSLKIESESSAPGEKPQFIGVREQRVTNIVIFVMVGCSVFFTSILQLIPMPVLYGVFLYMGTSSLKGSQFWERILIIFMPQKYQPDYVFLRHVPTYKVHLFTLIQVTCFALLWGVKSYKKISITFPLMLVVIILIRKLLDFVFTRKELKILDDIMPESTKRKREEEKELFKQEVGGDISSPGSNSALVPNTSSGNMTIPLANGNVLKIPMKEQINITSAMDQSGAWKSVNQNNGKSGNSVNKPTNGKKKRSSPKDAKSEEEQKRLSTMREEDDEEDCGITIKVEAPTPIPSSTSGHASPNDDKNGETPV